MGYPIENLPSFPRGAGAVRRTDANSCSHKRVMGGSDPSVIHPEIRVVVSLSQSELAIPGF